MIYSYTPNERRAMLTTFQLFFIFSLIKGTSLKRYPLCFINDFYENKNNEKSNAADPYLYMYLLNKTSSTSIDDVIDQCTSICPDISLNKQIFGVNVICLECDCRRPACEIFDNCCEEFSESLTISNRSGCYSESPKLVCDSKSAQDFHFLYIRSCPENYHDNEEVKRLCQEDVGVNDTTVETFVRVLDSETQVVYYNTYCAMCNQVLKPVQLALDTTCTSYMLVYMAENINDLIRLMLLNSKHCNVSHTFDDDVRPFECYEGNYKIDQVNQCEQKNPRKTSNADIVETCDESTSNRDQVYDDLYQKYYKDIVCTFCDLGQCLQLKCSPGKKLTNGTCTSIFNQIKGLGYRMKTLLVVDGWDEFKDNVTDLLDIAEQQLLNDLEDISDGFNFQLGVVKDYHQNASKNFAPILWANVFILASKFINRDLFEENTFDLFFSDSLNKSQFYYHRILTEDMYTNCCDESNTIWPVRYKALNNLDLHVAMSLGSEHSIPLTSTLTCSFITFQQFTINFNISNPGLGVTITLDLGGTSVTISNISDINTLEVTTGDELNVCREILDRYNKTNTDYNLAYFNLIYKAKIVLSYVCMGASELCLLMTLVTYLSFHELRTAPGINNMFLSLSLLLAQLALIVASSLYEQSNFCTFIGIATHFLWLWQFTWSFLCSFHMFQAFTSKIPAHSKRTKDIYIHAMKLLAFSLSVPSVIVSSVIISSYLTTQTLGYGRHSCYLDSTFLIGVSLIGPLCLVSFSNLAFLVVTVLSIHRVNRLLTFDSMRADQFKNLKLYVKLSTVTGTYWIVAIVAEAFDNDILRFLSTLLNGLQGVTIFVSYTCNKRVYQLFSTRSSSRQTVSASNTTETVLS